MKLDGSTLRPGVFPLRGRTTTLAAVSVYAIVVAAVLWAGDGLPLAVRLPLVLPLLLVAPGYAVVTALFPSSGTMRSSHSDADGAGRVTSPGLTTLERGALSVVASVAVVPMVALAIASVASIAVGPILAGVAGVTVLASVVAVLRAPAAGALAMRQSDGSTRTVRDRCRAALGTLVTDRLTQVAVALAAVLLLASAAVAFTGGPADPASTEFYLASETGTPGDADVATGEYDLRITHHGEVSQRYTVVVLLEGGDGSSAELRRSSTVVDPGETAGETYSVDESELDGASTVRFLLYEGTAPESPSPDTAHRVLKLSVDGASE